MERRAYRLVEMEVASAGRSEPATKRLTTSYAVRKLCGGPISRIREWQAALDPRPMLTQGEDVEAHALAGQGWSVSAIARHAENGKW